MPAARPATIVNAILDAIQQSGGTGVYVSDQDRTHPRQFRVHLAGQTFTLWVYAWTLTHGGRRSLPDEYRIQMTSVASPLQLNPSGPTVLLGYYPDLGLFAGFDIQVHRTFTTGSPSIQIGIDAVLGALQHGLDFAVKSNQEIAIGIRPDHLLVYALNSITLHESGQHAGTLELLQIAARAEDIPLQQAETLGAERRMVVTTISRYSRDASFRQQVLDAYGHRCAVTRAQLRLVDASHIIPVPAVGSIDHVTNGIALSPTMHRAYDNALVYLDETFYMRLNQEKVRELELMGLRGGLNDFSTYLDRVIHLPADQGQWPNPQFISEANRYRRVSGYL